MDEIDGAAITQGGEIKALLNDSVTLLASVRSSLTALLSARKDGEPGILKDIAGKYGELESALKRVFDAEQRFNDWYAKQAGHRVSGDIDFDAVRHEIGCRLSRLRDCCRSD